MSVLTLNVDEVMRTLSAESSNPFVVHDKEVDIVRFAINSGFADIVLDGQVALRVMYQRPGESEVRAQTLTYYDTDGLHNYYDWQLAQSDLAKNGSLMVALCILDISGGEVSEWHTTPCVVRVLSTIHTDDSDEGDDTITPTVKERVAVLESMIQRVASGAPIVVSSTSAMTDTDQIYVLSTDRKWYYHNGTTWVSGGTYGAVATDTTLTQSGVPADAKEVGDKTNALKSTVDTLSITVNGSDGQSIDKTGDASWTDGYGVAGNTGSIIGISNYSYAQYSIPDGVTSISGYTRAGNDISQGMAFYTSDGAYISGDNHYPSPTGYDWNYSFEVPDNAGIVRISCATSRKSQFTCNFTYNATGGLANDVEDLKTTIEDLPDVSSDITEIKNEIGENLSYYWIDGYCIYLPSSAASKGLYYQNSSQSIAVVDVRSCAGGTIKGHTRLGDDYGIAFCDKNDICISLVSRSGSDYEWDFEINVPKSAKYAKITCKTTSKTLFAVKGYGIISGITNSEHLGRFEYDVPQNVFGLDSDRSDFHYDSQTRLQDVYDWFDILMHTFPRNITKVQIGTSTTPEGTYASIDSSEYPINAYIIQGDSYVSGNDFIIASGIHGDESSGDGIQSVISVAYFIRDMLCNPSKNKYLSFMKWNCKILVIPVMNPWGYQNGRRCNGRGVDVNRNFDLNWVDSTSYGYSAGTAAFSENESRYVKDYIVNNFANAIYCTELHTRGGNTLPDDDRWWTKVTTGNTTMGNVATDVGRYMQRMYGGSLSDAYTDTEEPTFRSYVDHVIAIPTLLTEFAKSFHQDILTFNSDMLMVQYVRYFGAMQQGLLDAYLMPNT